MIAFLHVAECSNDLAANDLRNIILGIPLATCFPLPSYVTNNKKSVTGKIALRTKECLTWDWEIFWKETDTMEATNKDLNFMVNRVNNVLSPSRTFLNRLKKTILFLSNFETSLKQSCNNNNKVIGIFFCDHVSNFIFQTTSHHHLFNCFFASLSTNFSRCWHSQK